MRGWQEEKEPKPKKPKLSGVKKARPPRTAKQPKALKMAAVGSTKTPDVRLNFRKKKTY